MHKMSPDTSEILRWRHFGMLKSPFFNRRNVIFLAPKTKSWILTLIKVIDFIHLITPTMYKCFTTFIYFFVLKSSSCVSWWKCRIVVWGKFVDAWQQKCVKWNVVCWVNAKWWEVPPIWCCYVYFILCFRIFWYFLFPQERNATKCRNI